MWKLGRIGHRRDSRQRWRKPQVSKEGELTEGDERGEEGNTLMHVMVCMYTSTILKPIKLYDYNAPIKKKTKTMQQNNH